MQFNLLFYNNFNLFVIKKNQEKLTGNNAESDCISASKAGANIICLRDLQDEIFVFLRCLSYVN